MRKYRLTYKNIYSEIIFTAIITAKSIRGAKQKARNLEPDEWVSETITSLESEFNLKLDKIEFNY
jgi:hypothetical protein